MLHTTIYIGSNNALMLESNRCLAKIALVI